MAPTRRIRFSVSIAAPADVVYRLMIDPQAYRDWTAAFCEGSYFEGSWQPGERIRFLAPGGGGMVAEIAENRPAEFISIRHLGHIAKGVEDTQSEAVRAWAPAYENYSFERTPEGGTRLVVDQDVTDDYAADLSDAWPKALARLKALCEARQPGRA